MYSLEFLPAAIKDLKKIDKLHQKQIKVKIELLAKDPSFLKPNIKVLQGKYHGLCRLRVGNYRVVFQVIDEKVVILIINIGHRKDVY